MFSEEEEEGRKEGGREGKADSGKGDARDSRLLWIFPAVMERDRISGRQDPRPPTLAQPSLPELQSSSELWGTSSSWALLLFLQKFLFFSGPFCGCGM